MCIEEDGNAHGVFLLNSNAMGKYVGFPDCGLVLGMSVIEGRIPRLQARPGNVTMLECLFSGK